MKKHRETAPTLTLQKKIEHFVEEYLISKNGRKAAIAAGYSPTTASARGSQMLTRPDVQSLLARRQADLQGKLQITQERVLQEYARIAFFDPADIYDQAFEIKSLHDIPPDIRAVISKVTVSTAPDGARTVNISLADKTKALDALSKHLGLFNNDDAGREVIIINAPWIEKKGNAGRTKSK